MDEKTTAALREVVEDMAKAIELGTKNSAALISFLEDMLFTLEAWAAQYNVALDSKAAMAMDLHHHDPSSQFNPTKMDSAPAMEQVVADKGTEADDFQKGEASVLHSVQMLNNSAHSALFDGKNSVGIFCFEAGYERVQMQAGAEKRHVTCVDTCGTTYEGQAQMQPGEASRHACFLETETDMHHHEKRAQTTCTGVLTDHLEHKRCPHESMAVLGGAGTAHIDPRIDKAYMHPSITPAFVHSNLHVHHVGEHSLKKPTDKLASKNFELEAAMPLHGVKREPHESEQKCEEIDSDWLQEGSSMYGRSI